MSASEKYERGICGWFYLASAEHARFCYRISVRLTYASVTYCVKTTSQLSHRHAINTASQPMTLFLSFFQQDHPNGSLILFSARCNIYISRLCYDVSVRLSVRLSVTEVHWRIIANLGFKFRSKFTAYCGRSPQCARMHCESQCMRSRGACREEGRGNLALC